MRYLIIFGTDFHNPFYTITLTEALRIGYEYLQKHPEGGVKIKKSKSPHVSDYEMFRDYIGWKPRTFVQSDKGIHLVNHGGYRYKRVYSQVGLLSNGRKKVFYSVQKPER